MPDLTRRTVLIGAALSAPLSACAAPAQTPEPEGPKPAAGKVLTQVADVPVGSGTIAGGMLITQPTAGVFKAFVARCTHAGCALTKVRDAEALCPCHGSAFGLDGNVLRGPAMAPLTATAVSVRGAEIVAD